MSAKSSKDKALCGSPRLVPRPTAASAARAARNASNRNVTVMSAQLPPRTSASLSPVTAKNKCLQPHKGESKPDFKSNQSENGMSNNNYENESVSEDVFGVVDAVFVEEIMPDQKVDDVRLHEINENDVFEKEKMSQLAELPEERECAKSKETPRSRPQTPSKSSRPQTPRSLPASRPTTPAAAVPGTPRVSRPSTPVHRFATPTRPNTPRASSRPITPSSPTNNTQTPPAIREEDVRNAYALKEQEFQNLKKELDLKQQAVLEVFDAMLNLRERMTREGVSGGGEGNVQELVVFNVADWTAQEVRQLCQDAAAASSTNGGAAELINTTVIIDEHALADLDANVLSIPRRFADLCLQAYTTRQELIDWVKGLIEHNLIKDENGENGCLERISRYNAQGLELCESLREIKSHADDAIDTVSQLSRRACRERNALIAVGESLVREIARLRQDLEARTVVVTDVHSPEKELTQAIEEAPRDQQGVAGRTSSKDKVLNIESQLRQARVRITKMDKQLRESEASIAGLTSTVKTLEDQSRQREVQLEARARKLKESLKTGEVASGHLAQQRDALQVQINELKEQIEKAAHKHKFELQDMANQIKTLKVNIENQQKLTEIEKESKEACQAALGESQNLNEELKKQLIEFENNKASNQDLPTKREMDLWAELQAVKETLHLTEDEVTTAKREKAAFLESFTKIVESDNKVGLQQRLAAELLSKEDIVAKMQMQIRELMKNIKFNDQKVSQYEQFIRDLQGHYRNLANCQESPNGMSYQDLQREIMNLKMSLLEAGHRNEELSEWLAQKEQQIEQQDKTSRAQIREELISMLKNKETEQSRELIGLQQDLEHRMKIVDEVNKQIAAKAEEIHELFSTLDNKQQQIHRLEKIVLALEEQQRRAQAQRTRHEEKIATLEHELAACGNRKERLINMKFNKSIVEEDVEKSAMRSTPRFVIQSKIAVSAIIRDVEETE